MANLRLVTSSTFNAPRRISLYSASFDPNSPGTRCQIKLVKVNAWKERGSSLAVDSEHCLNLWWLIRANGDVCQYEPRASGLAFQWSPIKGSLPLSQSTSGWINTSTSALNGITIIFRVMTMSSSSNARVFRRWGFCDKKLKNKTIGLLFQRHHSA